MSIKYKLQIECGNDAFTEEPTQEVARMLRSEADRLERESISNRESRWTKGQEELAIKLRDFNGNTVGCAKFVKE